MATDNTINDIVVANMKRLREEKGWRKSDLARHADVDGSHLSNLENGKKHMGLELLGRIAEALGVEPYVMLQTNRVEEFSMRRKLEEIEKLPELKKMAIEQMVNAFLRESRSSI